jgi:phosphoglycerol geranylgeranyltransferase
MKNALLTELNKKKQKNQKLFALLLDPDAFKDSKALEKVCKAAERAKVDWLLIGGSIITTGNLDMCVEVAKKSCRIPVVLFPGNIMQVNTQADGILLLSLISGRNPDLLIGKHVLAAPTLKQSNIQILPTGYMLIDGGRTTSVSYMSNTTPIPADKPDIAACTAMAGEQLGLQLIYMDAGSGAIQHIPDSIIQRVSKNVDIPVIVGGGIRTALQAKQACKSGADMVVVGNAAEKDPDLIAELAAAVHNP